MVSPEPRPASPAATKSTLLETLEDNAAAVGRQLSPWGFDRAGTARAAKKEYVVVATVC